MKQRYLEEVQTQMSNNENHGNLSFLYLLGNKMDLEAGSPAVNNNKIREVEFDEGQELA